MFKIANMDPAARDAIDAHIRSLFDVDPATLDPVARYQVLNTEQEIHIAIRDRLAEMKKEALAELEDSGMDRATIAKTVGGLTRQRVGDILGKRKDARKGY